MADERFQIAADAAERYERHVAPFMGGFADAVVAAGAVGPSSTVLDVACGTGFVTRRARAVVGPGGRVVGADVNPAMLAVAARSCPTGIEWVAAPAAHLPFEVDEFDVALCQQGLQFFPDPVAALSEVRRVTRPGGRLAATVWAGLDLNPYLAAQTRALEAACGAAAVGSLRAAVPAAGDRFLLQSATAAGWSGVEVHTVRTEALLPPLSSYVADQVSATPWGPLFAALDEEGRCQVVDEVSADLASFSDRNGQSRVPFGSFLVSATA